MGHQTERAIGSDAEGFHFFHRVVLPARISAGNGALAFSDLAPLGTLGLQTTAGAYTYVPVDGSIDIVEGADHADTVIDLDFDAFVGLVSDLDTAPGLFYGGRVTVPKGKALRFVRWEPGLRALYHGLPIFDPTAVDLRDRHGAPLDPTRSFPFPSLTDPDTAADARHFLVTTGYIVVGGVFDPDEVAGFLESAGALEERAQPGDSTSWWGRTSDGAEILNRVLNAAEEPRLADLHQDPGFAGSSTSPRCRWCPGPWVASIRSPCSGSDRTPRRASATFHGTAIAGWAVTP